MYFLLEIWHKKILRVLNNNIYLGLNIRHNTAPIITLLLGPSLFFLSQSSDCCYLCLAGFVVHRFAQWVSVTANTTRWSSPTLSELTGEQSYEPRRTTRQALSCSSPATKISSLISSLASLFLFLSFDDLLPKDSWYMYNPLDISYSYLTDTAAEDELYLKC